MRPLGDYLRELYRTTTAGWNRFFFTPQDPATLGIIRIATGLMLFYTHLVWTQNFQAFLGPQSWIPPSTVTMFEQGSYTWSYWNWLDVWGASMPIRWGVHLAALVVFALLTVGLYSRAMSILALVITVAYAHRLPCAMFGLDQVNGMLALYLAIGPCGAAYSLDRWRARRAGGPAQPQPSVGANIAIRLLQLHMCIIYMFAGISKVPGLTWQDGTALWFAFANREYQSLDMTWLAHYELLVNAMTLLSIGWELSYAALVWPRITRPLVIGMAVPLHLGIGLCMGMMTFALAMLIGNLAFVSPWLVRYLIDPAPARQPVVPARSVTASRERLVAKRS